MKHKSVSLLLASQIILALILLSSQFLLPTQASDNYVIVPDDYPTIQEAINNATEGDTIYIKEGTYIINTSIILNKTLTLLGENLNETIIDSHGAVTLIISILSQNSMVQNLTLKNSAAHGYGIHIKDVTNIKIRNNHIENCSQGIVITNSTHCEISRSTITNSDEHGLHFKLASSYNMIFWNTIKNNTQAITIDYVDSKKNLFYQNNFITNNIQTSGYGIPANSWNNTYPAAGNYWSNYTSTDAKNGVLQNENGSDGIGDQPYELYLGAKDHYPIMGYIHWFHAYRWDNIDYYILVSSNASKALNLHFECSGTPFTNFTLPGSPELGFCRVTFRKQLLWAESDSWTVTIDDEEKNYTHISDENYTCIYFSHNYLDIKTVKIQGTDCVPEFSPFSILMITIAIPIIAVILKITRTNARLIRRNKFQNA